MTEIPLYFPTCRGDAAGIVSVPDRETDLPAVLLLTGDANSRTRVGVLADVARRLSGRGHPVLRFDYPGAGLSNSDVSPKHEELAVVALEAADWLLSQTGCSQLLTAGHCMGARFALVVAAYNEAVTRAVAVGCPIRKRQVIRSQVRTRLAAKSTLGPALSSVLTRGHRSKPAAGWFPGLLQEIQTATPRAHLGFIYGSEDEFHADLRALLDEVGPEVAQHVSVSVRQGAQLRALTELEHHPWVASEIERLLIDPVSEVSYG